MLQIVEDDLSSQAMHDLLQLHADGMHEASPPGATHFLDLGALRHETVTMWSGWIAGELAGCGALRELDPHHGEVKSMRTDPAHLGQGVGRAILAHIADVAKQRGYRRLSLETGTGPPFEAAVHLYKSFGFDECGPFADYTASDFNKFFTLTL